MMARRTPSRSLGSKLKRACFALLPVLLLLVVAEVLAWVTIHRSFSVEPDTVTGGSLYTMRTGRWPWSDISRTKLNSMGYPDAEFKLVDKTSCTHVVFAGDSYVFGDGVNREASFFELVKARAERTDRRCVRFFNISQRATTIDQQKEQIEATIDLLKPDVVVLGQYQNDLTDLTKPGSVAHEETVQGRPGLNWGGIVDDLPLFQGSLVRFLSYQAFAFSVRNRVQYDILRHWSILADSKRENQARALMEKYDELFSETVRSLRARGVSIGVIIIPSKFDLMAQIYREGRFFEQLADRHKVPHLSLIAALDSSRRPYPYLMYDGHLSRAGNRVVADEVYEWLFERMPAPFDFLRSPASN